MLTGASHVKGTSPNLDKIDTQEKQMLSFKRKTEPQIKTVFEIDKSTSVFVKLARLLISLNI